MNPQSQAKKGKGAKAEYVKAGVLPRLISAARPRVLIEFDTPRQARAAARFWNAGEGKHAALSKMFREHGHPVNCDYLATHTLNLIQGGK